MNDLHPDSVGAQASKYLRVGSVLAPSGRTGALDRCDSLPDHKIRDVTVAETGRSRLHTIALTAFADASRRRTKVLARSPCQFSWNRLQGERTYRRRATVSPRAAAHVQRTLRAWNQGADATVGLGLAVGNANAGLAILRIAPALPLVRRLSEVCNLALVSVVARRLTKYLALRVSRLLSGGKGLGEKV